MDASGIPIDFSSPTNWLGFVNPSSMLVVSRYKAPIVSTCRPYVVPSAVVMLFNSSPAKNSRIGNGNLAYAAEI
jgi:hypothetical protein